MATHKTPYGYEMVRGRIVVNVPEAETIRWIFQKRAEGRSVWSIARELYDGDDPYFKDSKRKTACKISTILYDERYAGADDFEPIVEPELFSAVQSLKGKPWMESQNQRCIVGRVAGESAERKPLPKSTTYIPDKAVFERERDLKALLNEENADAGAIKTAIMGLASAKYDSIM
ncbi:MAG: recombinase family protein [Oscillospiraceae bacterium]|nr:recombinase family protein [Oscillospiraceae bacterium]